MMVKLELLHFIEGLLGRVGEGDAGSSRRDVLLQRLLLLIQLRLLLLGSVWLLLCWQERILIIIIRSSVLCNELLETKHVRCRHTFLYRVEQVR